ncbi:MAG: hypothetical protein JWN38_158 [Candidatus Saccharibacteria bacterium]|nr:hypothetical protein [Candidatus Saccharibacteria bacterium]
MQNLKDLFAKVNASPIFVYVMTALGLVLTIIFVLSAFGGPNIFNILMVIVLGLLTASYGREIFERRKR